MAKELPYFKFFTGEWANGDITCESYEAQGLFINICSLYWSKQGELKEKHARKKFKCDDSFNDLIESELIKVEEGKLVISFLDEQMSETKRIRQKQSEGGKNSQLKRKLKSTSSIPKDDLKYTSSNKIREDKDKRIEDNTNKANLFYKWFFDPSRQASLDRLMMKHKTNIPFLKERLVEFLDVEKEKSEFKDRDNGDINQHFTNWLKHNPPREYVNKSNRPKLTFD